MWIKVKEFTKDFPEGIYTYIEIEDDDFYENEEEMEVTDTDVLLEQE